MNISFATKILSQLLEQGVSEFCLCPGSRNAPFVFTLSQTKRAKVYSFFDERSAGFFAIGRIKKTKSPTCVITTSGTAVGELLPSVMEAYHSGLPLVLITADRPISYRGKGCPQTTLQKDIFSSYTNLSYDVEVGSKESFFLDEKSPTHINVCFDEPFLDENLPKEIPTTSIPKRKSIKKKTPSSEKFFKSSRYPLILVGNLPPGGNSSLVSFIKETGLICFLESSSGLKHHKEISSQIVSGEKILTSEFFQKYFDGIIRFGGVPTLRFWRDLEKIKCPVLNVSHEPFSGLSYIENERVMSFDDFFNKEFSFPKNQAEEILEKDRSQNRKKNQLLKEFPLSEPNLVRFLSSFVSQEDTLFLGNSLPIRQWDQFSEQRNFSQVFANKGLNGIDGLVSTSVGLLEPSKKLWSVLGDMSTLYDLSGLWGLQFFKEAPFCLAVLNNQKSMIFEQIFGNKKIFLNEHKLNFKKWAEMFSLDHFSVSSLDFPDLPRHCLLEIRPHERQTQQFWNEWQKIWKEV